MYTYFQIPLMVIVFLPALEGLREQWREAAVSLGASTWQYWREVAVPLLTPAFLGSALLLFANAFAAYATAAALVSQGSPIVPLLIRAALTSEVVLGQSGFAYALALEMIVVVAVVMVAYNAAGAAHREVAAMRRTRLGGKVFRACCGSLFGAVLPVPAVRDGRLLHPQPDRTAAARCRPWKNLVADEALYQAIVISLLLAVFTVVADAGHPGADDDLGAAADAVGQGHRRVPLPAAADDPRAGDRGRAAQRLPVGDVPPRRVRADADVRLRRPGAAVRVPSARRRAVGHRPEDAVGGGALARRGLDRRRSLRVVVPNIWSGILSAAFISIAVVLGEYTIASLSGYETLQVQIVLIGKSDGPTSVAASLAVLLFGFVLLLVLSLLTRGRRRSTATTRPCRPTPAPNWSPT